MTDVNGLYIDSIEHKETVKWMQKVRINNEMIKFKIDTGSDINVLPIKYAKKCGAVKINKYDKQIQAYGGAVLKHFGTCELVCEIKGNKVKLNFVLIETDSCPIIGRTSSEELNLVRRIDQLTNQVIEIVSDSCEKFIQKNMDSFTGLGCFADNVKFELIDKKKCV